MWNQLKPPSVRDLAARIETRAVETATELARIREEQRALQRALEAEQAARLDAIAAAVDRVVALSDRLSDTQQALETALARLTALEGDEIPAEVGSVTTDASSQYAAAGPGGEPLLSAKMAWYDPVIEPPAEGSAHPEVDSGAPAAQIPPGNALNGDARG